MVVEKLPEINPPYGRVPGRGPLAILISGSRRRRNRGEIRDVGSLFGVSVLRVKYMPKGAPGEVPSSQAAIGRGPTLGRAKRPPGRGRPPSDSPSGLRG